jgi:hypothetical protein
MPLHRALSRYISPVFESSRDSGNRTICRLGSRRHSPRITWQGFGNCSVETIVNARIKSVYAHPHPGPLLRGGRNLGRLSEFGSHCFRLPSAGTRNFLHNRFGNLRYAGFRPFTGCGHEISGLVAWLYREELHRASAHRHGHLDGAIAASIERSARQPGSQI